jgi:uncharacterized membrane protein YjgN (DUF898 family)
MKNYFDFTLTGKKFLPIWLIYYALIIIPYVLIAFYFDENTHPEEINYMMIIPLIAIIVIAFFISFYIITISIENVQYKESSIVFEGNFSEYLGKILLGLLLTIVTLSIYLAWFIRDLTRFFVNNSSLKNNKFEFLGKGGKLFVIILLALYLPMILISVMLAGFIKTAQETFFTGLIYQAMMMLIIIPYMYYMYNWFVNVKYKDFHISWNTSLSESFGKILGEVLLGIITFGIYLPLAYLKLYAYFAERTIAKNENGSLRFGYELESTDDFLFIWGQLLLTIITLGIYFPWAYSKIGKRILSKTYTIVVSD